MPNQDKVILDTNLWISFLLTKEYSLLDKLFSDNSISLLFSQALLDEFVEVSQRPKFKKYFTLTDLEDLLIQIKYKAQFVEVTSNIKICRDAKDNFLLSLAKDGGATHLITGDKDLLDIKGFGRTKILTITKYILTK